MCPDCDSQFLPVLRTPATTPQDSPRPWHETEGSGRSRRTQGRCRKRKTNREAGRGKKKQPRGPQKEAKSGERGRRVGVCLKVPMGLTPHTGGAQSESMESWCKRDRWQGAAGDDEGETGQEPGRIMKQAGSRSQEKKGVMKWGDPERSW